MSAIFELRAVCLYFVHEGIFVSVVFNQRYWDMQSPASHPTVSSPDFYSNCTFALHPYSLGFFESILLLRGTEFHLMMSAILVLLCS